MNSLVVSGAVLLGLLLLVIVWRREKGGKAEPYDLQETLMSPAERTFFGALVQAVGDKARVFAKVRASYVLTPEAHLGKGKRQQALGKIGEKHFDFLLCHPADLSFLCAVELDDEGHRHQKRKARDLFLKAACDGAGLPLLQIPASSHYQVDELREQLLPLLARTTAPVDDLLPGERREPTFSPLLLDGVDLGTSHPGAAREPQVPSPQAEEAMPVLMEENPFLDPDEEEPRETTPHCPRCAAPLVAREARKGPHAGRLFLACSRFPECRYAAPQESVKH
ncbi:DUF2726 domain-containing protein [Aeromonas caviae]|uniref:DUF2726 domain-containing protein n=1 Tax=Aeromonas caviae TaxID=648 RepID=UPI00191DB503|nr:DUF2726 domain-containing protein [Aeromonas caviae]MBL0581550.1 DUF2726 domain-containing protein [Aeromonas caviae]MCR3928380.1 DUF2726 domain-containing protein [Aeromonas caviae]MDX7644499.1 DUF2726 domain-containing protein [Aeromonas caviae]MDX7797831.1 DUF2726 domain-containing protein [Aeromonas caviae]WMX35664.1 DUF2726 domain-containing protein [Aeromonas caviae]